MQLSAKVLSSIFKGLLIAIGVVGTAVGVLYCIIQRYYDATIERADGSVEIAGETVGIERTDLALEAGTETPGHRGWLIAEDKRIVFPAKSFHFLDQRPQTIKPPRSSPR